MKSQTYSRSVDETSVSANHAIQPVKIYSTLSDPAANRPHEPLLKRPLDILISSIMLLLSAPVTIFIGIAIKLEDGGPVFYRQQRWGRFGNKFMVLKFRTMIPNDDKNYGLKQTKENKRRTPHVCR